MSSASSLTVYKASAGSGKTFTIAAEYIALLLQGDAYAHRHILAVTFTNKATEEMKERILHNLERLAWPDRGHIQDFKEAVLERMPQKPSDRELQERARRALTELLHDYDRFRVETIDSFFQWLLANLAHELGLSAKFKIDLNVQQVIEKSVEELLKSVQDNQPLREWIVRYIRERIEEDRSWDIRGELKRLAKELHNETFQQNEQAIIGSLDPQNTRKLLHLFKNAVDGAKSGLVQAARELDRFISESGNGYDDFSNFNKCVGGFLRKQMNETFQDPSEAVMRFMEQSPLDEGDELGTGVWLKKSNRKDWPALRLRGEQIRERLKDYERLRQERLATIHTGQLTLAHFNALCLMSEIARIINAINAENNHFLLAKTQKLFNDLVKDHDAPFVFEKAGVTFRHVLIDEFQDTSRLQWNNFRKLLVNQLSSNDHCMLVGDVKQSIYRFRGGDSRILSHIGEEVAPFVPKCVSLDTNFRSAGEVVRFNNAFFPVAAELLSRNAHGDVEDEELLHIYSPSEVTQKTTGRQQGHVWVEAIETESGETSPDAGEKTNRANLPADEAETAPPSTSIPIEERLYEVIEGLHEKGLPYHEMTILVRNRYEGKQLLHYYADHHPHLPLTSDEAYQLPASEAVVCIIYALSYMADPTHSIAKAYITRKFQEQSSCHDTPANEEGSCDTEIPETLKAAMEEVRQLPLYECAERLVRIFSLDKQPHETPYLMAFLDHLLIYLEDYPSDIRSFLKYWDETLSSASIQGGNHNGVGIVTIHKSKGLAFHTVLLPFCNWAIEKDRMEDLLWGSARTEPFNQLPWVPVPAFRSAQVKQSDFSSIYDEEHHQQRIENLNLLYVAFTRARYNLYVWYAPKSGKRAPDMAFLLTHCVTQPQVKDCLSQTLLPQTLALETDAMKKTADPITVNIIPPAQRTAFKQSGKAAEFMQHADDDTASSASFLDRGKLLHALLSEIRTTDDIDATVTRYAQKGMLPTEAGRKEMADILHKAIDSVASYGWFAPGLRLYNECELLHRTPKGTWAALRPDRVTVTPDAKEVTVVDYKSGAYHSPDTSIGHAYHCQVKNYMCVLSRMGYPQVKGYLWYVDAGHVEPVDADTQGEGAG